jgi:hypothetical protein
MKAIDRRPLNPHEKALAEFLLSADFPGREELDQQLASAEAVSLCECGCGTINLRVVGASPRANCREPIPIEAYGDGIEVLLFVRDGLLASLEVVDHGDARPLPYPRPEQLKLWVPPQRKPSERA